MREDVETRVWLRRYVHQQACWWKELGIRGWVSGEYVYLTRYTRAGFALESVVIDTMWADRDGVQALIEGECIAMLRKRAERVVLGDDKSTVKADDWAALHPTLWEHLTTTRWDDGSPREPSSLLIFFQDSNLKGMLRDKAEGLCLWATGRNVTELLSAMEVMAADPGTEWREDRQAPGQTAKRRKNGGGR